MVELSPPDGPDLEPLLRMGEQLSGIAHAIQLTDMPFATPHVANLAAGIRLKDAGHEVILNVTCRDRNIIGQQGYLLGAAACGLLNIFCLRGDPTSVGDHPASLGVFETSGLQLIELARQMRDKGIYASGRRIEPRPPFFIGAALAPHAAYDIEALELLERKVKHGAHFVTTQPIFDAEALNAFLTRARLHLSDAHFIAGIGAITSRSMLNLLKQSTELYLPDALIERFEGTLDQDLFALGQALAQEWVRAALDAGVSGILLYPFDMDFAPYVELARFVRQEIDARRPQDI